VNNHTSLIVFIETLIISLIKFETIVDLYDLYVHLIFLKLLFYLFLILYIYMICI